ncbi:hypothetical protein [Chakrabartyella piscis]|uniref:hypothetical protein n=1 Tax=Chakrabartyella piscis TaxID=2918914 RepID=UPI002958B9F5|nr:hypothetical protein [Chakrabartyella piscis]
MAKSDVWQDFIDSLIGQHFENYKKTKESILWSNRMEHIDEMLTTNLTQDEKIMVEEVLFETGEQQEHYADILYEQGMKDCVMILKNMGVI